MKTFISLSALFLSLTLTATLHSQIWFFNDSSIYGIETTGNTASGDLSTAMGWQTTASGTESTAMGRGTTASGTASTAMGGETTASGAASTAMGTLTTASGDYSIAMGHNTEAKAIYSTAMGYETNAINACSTAMGNFTTASGLHSTAMGQYSIASGDRSTAMGIFTESSGGNSTAMGNNTKASDYTSLVVGKHNLAGYTVTASATEYSLDNTAFVIGNGSSWDNRSDALVVKFNGDATLAGNLNINSDARLKANIISLGSTLSKLLQIDGKSYTMKKDESEKQKIGLLAQDIEKVFPELVSESHGIKSVNYQGLVPVLINALKEQQNEIEILKQQQSEIDELKTMLKTLIEKT